MEFLGFSSDDFDVFSVPGLEPRMEALKAHLRPKLEQLGRDVAPMLSDLLGRPMFAHVAKHARRSVNPPVDSWVAFSADKRGYKKHPHFQIGAWGTHAFATFGLISESGDRVHFGQQVKQHAEELVELIPPHYYWFPDHTNPLGHPASEVGVAQVRKLADLLMTRRQGELLVGIVVPKEQAVHWSAGQFMEQVHTCFRQVQPLYRLASSEVVPL